MVDVEIVQTLPFGTANALNDNAMGHAAPAQLPGPASVRALAQDEYLYREGEAKRFIFRVESGALCLTMKGAHGTPEFVELVTAGSFVGLGFLDYHIHSAAALIDTSISIWPLSALPELCLASAAARDKHAEATEREFGYRRRQLVASTAQDPVLRVAAFLTAVSRLNEIEGRNPNVIAEELRSGDVADFLKMEVEALAQALVELERRGLVRSAGTGLALLGRAELEHLGMAAAA
jgi:CRP-like cAMP-binding protein